MHAFLLAALIAIPSDGSRFELPVSFARTNLVHSGYFTLARWDFDYGGDFSDAMGVEFDFRADDLGDFSAFMFHFFSGNSCRSLYFEPDGAENRWRHVRIPRSTWMEEGKDFDWSKITRVRMHANVIPGVSEDKRVLFEIRNFAKWRGDWSVVFLEPESVIREHPAETWGYRNSVNTVVGAFAKLGLDTPRVRDYELTERQLRDTKVVVLPKNPKLPEDTLRLLAGFQARGGRIIGFYDSDPKMLERLGLSAKMISRRETRQDEGEGRFLKLLAETLIEVRPDMKEKVVSCRRKRLDAQRKTASAIGAMPSPKGERRVVWCHRAYGIYGDLDWEASARELASLGVTDLLVNLAWGGIAYYESKVLPVSPLVATKGDALALCTEACHRYGIRVHVWKVNWKISSFGGGAGPQTEFKDRMRAEGRLSADAGDKEDVWLCPTDPRNQDLEIAAMCELASKTGVDGIHFDYIRFSSRNYCFCEGCRHRFEKTMGAPVANWPKDVQTGGVLNERWRRFRCDAVTRVVAETAAKVRKAHPGVLISASTRGDMVTAREWDGQDWPLWCEKGYLDFACPMDYAECWTSYRNVAMSQKRRMANAKTKLFPGMGLSCWQADGHETERLAKGIEAVRKAGFEGFAVYEVDRRGMEVLKRLADGPLRPCR